MTTNHSALTDPRSATPEVPILDRDPREDDRADRVREALEESFPASDAPAHDPRPPHRPAADPVQEASEESFPASDPPSWTATTGLGDPHH